MTALCKNCKHWGTNKRQRGWDQEHDGYAGAQNLSPAPAQRICAAVTLPPDGSNRFLAPGTERRMRLACVVGANSYQADLWSSPEFGCVLFEAHGAVDAAPDGDVTRSVRSTKECHCLDEGTNIQRVPHPACPDCGGTGLLR